MALRHLVNRVRAPVGACRAVSSARGEHDARPVSGADEHVVRPGRAVDEVPPPERALLTLEDRERLAGEDEEVLLVVLPVVHRHRLAGAEDGDVDPELQEVRCTLEACALELAERAAARAFPPLRLAGVQDEPALPLSGPARAPS